MQIDWEKRARDAEQECAILRLHRMAIVHAAGGEVRVSAHHLSDIPLLRLDMVEDPAKSGQFVFRTVKGKN